MALKVLMIGAHPDDCEGLGGGYASLLRKAGNEVRFLSLTNGGLGHFALAPAELVQRRQKEAETAASMIGATSEILPIPDGHLDTSVKNREALVRSIRRFAPDLILTHRPNDYHVDHRNASLLVQDASYMLQVPGFCPDTPVLRYAPHIMYFFDRFTQPEFRADIVISVDSVIDQKYEMMACHKSQYFEWLPWVDGILDQVPKGDAERLEWLRSPRIDEEDRKAQRAKATRGEKGQYQITLMYQDQLKERYGEKAKDVIFCEAFQACEYGAGFTEEDFDKYFSF